MVGSAGETGNEIKLSDERIDEESDARRSQGVSRMSQTSAKPFKIDVKSVNAKKANKQYLNADL